MPLNSLFSCLPSKKNGKENDFPWKSSLAKNVSLSFNGIFCHSTPDQIEFLLKIGVFSSFFLASCCVSPLCRSEPLNLLSPLLIYNCNIFSCQMMEIQFGVRKISFEGNRIFNGKLLEYLRPPTRWDRCLGVAGGLLVSDEI